MKPMRSLSLRHRIPLEISLMVLLTGLAITGLVLWREYRALQVDALESAERLGRVLAHAVTPYLKLDDQWQAYLTLKTLYRGGEPSWLLPTFILILDTGGRTLVASDPVRFPIAREPQDLGEDGNLLAEYSDHGEAPQRNLVAGRQWTFQVEPLTAGEAELGTLVLAFPNDRVGPRFFASATRWLLGIGLATTLVLPFGWWLGRRIARPLGELGDCVAKLGNEVDTPEPCPVPAPYSELVGLRARVDEVAVQLRAKRELERRVIRTERQAALGRLAAGVAHEINNPLGGMMTAVAMYKRHSGDPEVAGHTMSLLERGLDQIRHIVSALLVEVKGEEQRGLGPRDVDDIAELVAPGLSERGLHLDTHNRLAGEVALPAGPVRQILLNLALNAVQATPDGGSITLRVDADEHGLHIDVTNPGAALEPARLERLFEPFDTRSSDETGLGLWLTDQTVRQLGGEIEVASEPGRTTFAVSLPIGGGE